MFQQFVLQAGTTSIYSTHPRRPSTAKKVTHMCSTRTGHPDRFSLVTAAHHFLLDVLPFREPESSEALATFVAAMKQFRGPTVDIDAILLRCLAVLDTRHGRRIPSLVDLYVAGTSTPEGSLTQFTRCVEDCLRSHCIVDRTVQHALEVIAENYAEPSFTRQVIARTVGTRLSALEAAFKREMGRTISEYIRGVRLRRAAMLLATTNKSIKEVWAEIGYNYGSNFTHDFMKCFGDTPRAFRAASIQPLARKHFEAANSLITDGGHVTTRAGSVLLVDDDESTRWTLSTYLNHEGFSVSTASNGNEGLCHAQMAAPDVILTDYRLGDMDGLQFLYMLRHAVPRRQSAVVLYTADWTLFDRKDEIDELHATVVSKLCDVTELVRVITGLTKRPPGTVAHPSAPPQ